MSRSEPARRPRSTDHPKHLLPSEFDAEGIVGPLKADTARWLVSTILRKLVDHDVDARGFAILSAIILQRVMGDGYAKIVRALIEAGVLLRSPYREGRSYGYRLADEYLAGQPRLVPVTNPVIRDRLERECERHDAEQAQRRLPIHGALDEAQQGLTILPAAHAAVESLLPLKARLCQRAHVDRLDRRELRLSVSSTGRVFNGLTGVKSDLRNLVRLDGESIGCVDICNSQPALLGNLLVHGFPHEWAKRCLNIKHNRSAPLLSLPGSLPSLPAPSAVSFAVLASSGTLYDSLAASAGLSRPFVKKRFLVDVLAKKWRYPSEVERAFRERFPDVWEWIQRVNGIPRRRPTAPKHRSKAKHSPDQTANLIRLLQRVESLLVVETLSPDLVKRIPIVTLHDAVFSRQQDLEEVEEAFDKVLEDIGWKLALKREGAA